MRWQIPAMRRPLSGRSGTSPRVDRSRETAASAAISVAFGWEHPEEPAIFPANTPCRWNQRRRNRAIIFPFWVMKHAMFGSRTRSAEARPRFHGDRHPDFLPTLGTFPARAVRTACHGNRHNAVEAQTSAPVRMKAGESRSATEVVPKSPGILQLQRNRLQRHPGYILDDIATRSSGCLRGYFRQDVKRRPVSG